MVRREYTEAETALHGLLANLYRLRREMGGHDGSELVRDPITKWDNKSATFFYLERNMRWAQELLDKIDSKKDNDN